MYNVWNLLNSVLRACYRQLYISMFDAVDEMCGWSESGCNCPVIVTMCSRNQIGVHTHIHTWAPHRTAIAKLLICSFSTISTASLWIIGSVFYTIIYPCKLPNALLEWKSRGCRSYEFVRVNFWYVIRKSPKAVRAKSRFGNLWKYKPSGQKKCISSFWEYI